MEILKFEEVPKRTSRKRSVNSSRKTILGIAAAAAIAVVGSTLAANITINSSSNLEFGQGLTQTAACSGGYSIDMTPTSSFVNASGAGSFYLTGIKFSNTGLATCAGKTFTIKAWDNTASSSALYFATANGVGYNQATFVYSSTALSYSLGITAGVTSGQNAATIAIAPGNGTGIATSGAISKLTIESN
jgi:hypothetical protein